MVVLGEWVFSYERGTPVTLREGEMERERSPRLFSARGGPVQASVLAKVLAKVGGGPVRTPPPEAGLALERVFLGAVMVVFGGVIA